MEQLTSGVRLRLSPAFTIREVDDAMLFFSDNVLRLDCCSVAMRRCLQLLVRGAERAELLAVSEGDAELDAVLALLLRVGAIVLATPNAYVEEIVERQVDYWTAWGVDGNRAQSSIGEASVLLLGLGGIGAAVLQHLASGGVRRFLLVDGDQVNRKDLNRQLVYRLEQVGQPKVACAAEYVRSLHRTAAEIVTHVGYVTTVAGLESAAQGSQPDLLVLAADLPVGLIRDVALEWCTQRGVAFIEGACGFRRGGWGPLLRAEEIRGDREVKTITPRLPSPVDVMTASFGPTNALVAAHMAYDILHHLAGLPARSAGCMLTMDFDSGRTQRIRVSRYAAHNAEALAPKSSLKT